MKRTCSRLLVVVSALLVSGPSLATSVGAFGADGASAPQHETAEEVRILNIKSQTAWTHSAGPGGVLGEGHRSAYIAYDRNGNALEQTAYDEDGSILQRIVNVCDSGGLLIESVSEGPDSENSARSVFEYDGELIVATNSYRLDGTLLVATHHEYDEDGLVLSVLTEVPDAGIAQTMVFEYDEGGSAVRTVNYDSEGRILASTETLNDEDGRPAESTALLPDGSVGSVTRFEYDSEGRTALVEVYNADGIVLQSVSNVYGANGKVVETTTSNPAAGIEYRVAVEYDEDSKRLTERTYNKLGEIVSETRYEYEFYDEQAQE